jgi:hypothetical protein
VNIAWRTTHCCLKPIQPQTDHKEDIGLFLDSNSDSHETIFLQVTNVALLFSGSYKSEIYDIETTPAGIAYFADTHHDCYK